MAIQAKITTIQGVQLDKAYINIANPQISKVKQEDGTNKYILGANACVYANKDVYDTRLIPVEGFSVTCELDLESNVLTQAYKELQRSPRLTNIAEV